MHTSVLLKSYAQFLLFCTKVEKSALTTADDVTGVIKVTPLITDDMSDL